MKLILIALLISVVLSIQAHALGIATDYGSDIINISIAQRTAYFSFRLQNMKDEEVNLLVNVTSEKNIASLLNESTYKIAPMTTDVKFLIELIAPEGAKVGDVYNVYINIKQLSSQKGQIAFGQEIGKKFQVKIVDTDNANAPTTFAITKNKEISLDFSPVIIAIVAVLILCITYMYKRKKSLRKKINTLLKEKEVEK